MAYHGWQIVPYLWLRSVIVIKGEDPCDHLIWLTSLSKQVNEALQVWILHAMEEAACHVLGQEITEIRSLNGKVQK